MAPERNYKSKKATEKNNDCRWEFGMKEEIRYQGYFIYKGVAYGEGTEVLFSDKVHRKYYFSSELKNKPHKFIGGSTAGWLNFRWQEGDDWKYDKHSNVTIYNVDDEIAQIVNPVYVKLVSWQKQAWDNMRTKKVQPDVFGGWLLYIVVMLVGFIFKDALLYCSDGVCQVGRSRDVEACGGVLGSAVLHGLAGLDAALGDHGREDDGISVHVDGLHEVVAYPDEVIVMKDLLLESVLEFLDVLEISGISGLKSHELSC